MPDQIRIRDRTRDRIRDRIRDWIRDRIRIGGSKVVELPPRDTSN
jgi:hypothetical protein